MLPAVLLLTSCSMGGETTAIQSQALESDLTSYKYIQFQEKLANALDSELYENNGTLVTIKTDSNLDENDSTVNHVYFTIKDQKYKASFPLSDAGAESTKILEYYASCPSIKEMIVVDKFVAGNVNTYEGGRYHISGNKMWQLINDKTTGIIIQYFELNNEDKIVKQEISLIAAPTSDSSGVKQVQEDFTGWNLNDVKGHLSTNHDKTVITYTYDDFSSLSILASQDKMLKYVTQAAAKPAQPLFLTLLGKPITSVSTSTDGLKCALN